MECTAGKNDPRSIPKAADFDQFLSILVQLAEYVYRTEEKISIDKKLFMLLKCMEESRHLEQILMATQMITRYKSFF